MENKKNDAFREFIEIAVKQSKKNAQMLSKEFRKANTFETKSTYAALAISSLRTGLNALKEERLRTPEVD